MHRSSSSSHNPFFTSLKQLEKRLKLDDTHPSPPPPTIPSSLPIIEHRQENTQQTDSLGTPIYLNDNHNSTSIASTVQESEIPRQFLSNSPDFPPTHNSPPQENQAEIEETIDHVERRNLNDEVELLMQLLGLSDCEGPSRIVGRFRLGCNDDDEFYEKIVGLKGPKSGKEVDRLEGWIKHFLIGETKEPFALAHLLLGKASLIHSVDDSDGCEGFEFPSTIAEFLQSDPPVG